MEVDKFSKEYLLKKIFKVIYKNKKFNPKELKSEKRVQTFLMGSDWVLDSLGLLNFPVEVDSKFNHDFKNNFSSIIENFFKRKWALQRVLQKILNGMRIY